MAQHLFLQKTRVRYPALTWLLITTYDDTFSSRSDTSSDLPGYLACTRRGDIHVNHALININSSKKIPRWYLER